MKIAPERSKLYEAREHLESSNLKNPSKAKAGPYKKKVVKVY